MKASTLTRAVASAAALLWLTSHAEAAAPGAGPCPAGPHTFTGPIVNGHSRQPTPAEFEARKRALEEWSRDAAACAAGPGGAVRLDPPSDAPPDSR